MNKVATYLNEYLTGEVLTNSTLLDEFECDGSILSRRPEMVARVADTNDIRKIMRFCTQLSEKGYTLPVTPRGYGTDTTGAATTKGIVIDMTKYMNQIAGIDPKQHMIHVQAGISRSAVNAALSTHKGLGLAETSFIGEDGTAGGAISSGAAGAGAGRYGTIGDAIDQLEVVLSNGDVLQTGRLSKRDLSKKKGLSTLEGEIYRQVDNLISDNEELISKIDTETVDTAGFSGIAKVRGKGGSFDLTPLFVGSQGALGIISEVIVKAEFLRPELSVVQVAYKSITEAQEAADIALETKAAAVELFDGRIFKQVVGEGKKLDWAPEEAHEGGVLLVIFDDFSSRARSKSVKKLMKKLEQTDAIHLSGEDVEYAQLSRFHSVLALAENPAGARSKIVPSALSGLWVPADHLDVFMRDVAKLEKKYQLELPIFADLVSGYVEVLPILSTQKVSDRQKILKLVAEFAKMMPKYQGSFAGRGGDGRVKSTFVLDNMTKDERDLIVKIKEIFDPHGIFQAGVKSPVPVKELAEEINAWCRLKR